VPFDDPDEFESELEAIVERLQHWQVQKAIPDTSKKRELQDLEEMVGRAQRLLDVLATRRREQLEERRLANWLDAMTVSHATLLEAINETLYETKELTRSSQDRLIEIEKTLILRGQSAFTASQDIIDEGEYLWRVLATGVQGTESPGQLLKDGTSEYIQPAVSVLADAIEKGEW
jgi:hypothetical protein